MAVSDTVQDEGLVRVIGTDALGLNVVNMVVGAGIFVLEIDTIRAASGK